MSLQYDDVAPRLTIPPYYQLGREQEQSEICMQMQVRSVLRWQGDGRRRTQLAARRKGGVAARQGQSRITLGLAALRTAAAAAAQQHRHGNLKAKEKQQIKGQKRGLLKAAEMAAVAAVEAAQVPPHAGPRSKPRCCSCSGSRCRMDGKPGQWTISIPPSPRPTLAGR